MKKTGILCGALVVVAASGCHRDRHDRDTASGSYTGVPDVTGTYVTEASGTTLGKHWCYSGALVLDSTQHFGSVLTLCSDDGGEETKRIKGTYRLRTVRTSNRGSSRTSRTVQVILQSADFSSKTHTLIYKPDSLRFNEPWFLGAALRALKIPDPVLTRLSNSQLADSTALTVAVPAPTVPGKASTAPPASKKSSSKTLVAK